MPTKTLEETFLRYNLDWEPISELPTLLATQQAVFPQIKEHKVTLEVGIQRNFQFGKDILEQAVAGHQMYMDMLVVAEAHLDKWSKEPATVGQQLELGLLKDQCADFRRTLEQIQSYYETLKSAQNNHRKPRPKKKRLR